MICPMLAVGKTNVKKGMDSLLLCSVANVRGRPLQLLKCTGAGVWLVDVLGMFGCVWEGGIMLRDADSELANCGAIIIRSSLLVNQIAPVQTSINTSLLADQLHRYTDSDRQPTYR